MKLPAHLLLCLAAACEPAHRGDPAPVVNIDSDEPVHMSPMAAPRFAQPQPQPQQQQQPRPSPLPKKLQPKPKKAPITGSICGHPVTVDDPQDLMVDCGMG
jgi:hypothetical protein